MNSMRISEFRSILNPQLREVLKHRGFSQPNNRNFIRKNDTHEINIIWIQTQSSAPKVCVNLGVHYDFLPKAGINQLVEGKKITQPECAIKMRLTPAPSLNDYWWDLGAAEADEIARLVEGSALPYFDQYLLDGEIGTITPSQFKGDLSALLSSLTKEGACLLMARIYEHKEEIILTSEFAKLGIKEAEIRKAEMGWAVAQQAAFTEILKRIEQ